MDWWTTLLTAVKPTEAIASVLLAVAIVAILSGRLQPNSNLVDARKERDSWKAAYLESEKARGVLMSQNGELLEVARTANHILRSLPGGDSGVGQTSNPLQGNTQP